MLRCRACWPPCWQCRPPPPPPSCLPPPPRPVTALDTGSAGVWTGTDGVEDNLRVMIENVLGGFKALSEWSEQRTAGSPESGFFQCMLRIRCFQVQLRRRRHTAGRLSILVAPALTRTLPGLAWHCRLHSLFHTADTVTRA